VKSVTLDTNIYVSALQFGGKPMALLEMGLEGEIHVAISQAIIDETLRVLREKFSWGPAGIEDARTLITAAAHTVSPTQTLSVVKHDPPDNRILECAAESGSDFIVSGDRDLLRLGRHGEARIQPRD
jgi:putative PIN family toxin of toxin-antitoxin system